MTVNVQNIRTGGNITKIIVFILPLIFLYLMYNVRKFFYPIYEQLGLEDAVFESVQGVLYFLSCLIAAIIGFLHYRQSQKLLTVIFIFISLGCFIIGMEEISWGQRLLNHETTGIFEEHSVQKENNLHNLSQIYDNVRIFYILLGLYGTLSFILYKTIKPLKLLIEKINFQLLIVPWFLICYFAPLLINIIPTPFFAPQDFEVIEFVLSIGIFLFLLNILRLILVIDSAPNRPI